MYKRKKAVLPTILLGLQGWIAVRRFRARLAEHREREAEAAAAREAQRAREAGARARAQVEGEARAAAEWARRKEAAHTLRRVDATLFALKQVRVGVRVRVGARVRVRVPHPNPNAKP